MLIKPNPSERKEPAKLMLLNRSSADWRMSVHDRGAALAIASDGLRCQSRHQKEWHGCRAKMGVTGRGKYYYEVLVEDEGLCRIGFSTSEVSFVWNLDPQVVVTLDRNNLFQTYAFKGCRRSSLDLSAPSISRTPYTLNFEFKLWRWKD